MMRIPVSLSLSLRYNNAMKSRSGFTIVELLIVIVVIGILASITIIAFTNIRARAQLATAQSELSMLGKKSSLFNADRSRYPNSNPEWSIVFKDANMFENTRNGDNKSFILCFTADGSSYALIAYAPLINTTTGFVDGQKIYYTGPSGMKSFIWSSSVSGVSVSDRACKHVSSTLELPGWTYNLT
jgi:prepilin-type N-terminal cleavage/methylation domain-containing protein